MNKVKNIIITILALTVFILVLGRVGYHETHYTTKGIVTEITNGIVVITDEKGEMWEIESTDLKINDNVKIVFDNYGTYSNRYDDIIEMVERIEK